MSSKKAKWTRFQHLGQLFTWCSCCLQHVMTEESHEDKNTAGQDAPATDEMDEVIKMKDGVCVGPFQAEILEGRVTQVPAHDTHIMAC